MYVLKILDDAGLTLEQKKNAENFKALMGSLNLQSMRWSADESKLANDEVSGRNIRITPDQSSSYLPSSFLRVLRNANEIFL